MAMHPLFDQTPTAYHSLLWDVLGRSPLAVVVLDDSLVVREWSSGAERLFQWPAGDVLGRRWVDVGVVADPVRQRQGERLLAGVLRGEPWSAEWTGRRRDGSAVAVLSMAEPVRAPGHDEPVGVLFLSVDVTAREEFEQALLREAMHDRLTGLPNRALVLDELGAFDQEGPGAVLFVDLDGFKAVNDEFGHATGDRVLVEVADRLRGAVRAGDMVGRIGGDEFVVLCRAGGRAESIAASGRIAERIAGSLAQPVRIGSRTVSVSASVGVAVVGPETDAATLLDQADAAMYAAKGAGRATYRLDL